MRSIIEDNDLEVMATVARYVCSYKNIAKPAWWMKSKDCGPSAFRLPFFLPRFVTDGRLPASYLSHPSSLIPRLSSLVSHPSSLIPRLSSRVPLVFCSRRGTLSPVLAFRLSMSLFFQRSLIPVFFLPTASYSLHRPQQVRLGYPSSPNDR
jgi:hypothetical protein